MVPISKFGFAAYSVQIKRGFRCFPDTTSSQIKPRKLWLSRIFQAVARAVRQSARGAGLQTGSVADLPDRTTNRLQIIENGWLTSAWTARALAARVFIGFTHPESSWITDRLPVALWPEALKREIQQAGFAKSADLEVCATTPAAVNIPLERVLP